MNKAQNQERAGILSSANSDVVDKITHTNRSVRERAIHALTLGLSTESPEDIRSVNYIPLEFLEHDDVLGAIWYMETLGHIGNMIPMDVFEKVYERAITKREVYMEEGNTENVAILDKSLKALFRMAKKHPDIAKSSRFFYLCGNHEEMFGRTEEARTLYLQGMTSGEKDAYLALASLHIQNDEYAEAERIFRDGYERTHDVEFLGHIVRALCRQNKLADAYREYQIMQFLSGGFIPPFIIYQETIGSDGELLILEEYLAKYFTENSLVPSEALTKVVRNASEYVQRRIRELDKRLSMLDADTDSPRTARDRDEYRNILFELLHLYQTDVLSLGNQRSLGRYLWLLNDMAFGNLVTECRAGLEIFLSEEGSKEVFHEYTYRKNEEEDKNDPYVFQEILTLHVGNVGELYYNHEYYRMQNEIIHPILERAQDELKTPDGARYQDDAIREMLQSLKNEKDFFDALRPSLQTNYTEFIQAFDRKYGCYYRRQLQRIARDSEAKPENYPVLKEYTDIAFFFWLERLIVGEFPTDPDEIELTISEYRLDQGSIQDILLFAGILYPINPPFVVALLGDYPNMLDVPEGLYMITEGLRQLIPSERKGAIKYFHNMARDMYQARGFFEHVKMITTDILGDPETDNEEKAFALMTEANIAILKKEKEKTEEIIGKFITAGEQYGSTEGLMQAGDYYENGLGNYDKAMECYEKAFMKEESIEDGEFNKFSKGSIIVITQLLHCSIISGRFDTFQSYLQYAKMRGYDIHSYELAGLLWQGKKKEAIQKAISMITRKQGINDTPNGTLNLLAEIMDETFQSSENTPEMNIQKAHLSFIQSNFLAGGYLYDTDVIKRHWNYVLSIRETYEGMMLYRTVEGALSPICGEQLDEEDGGFHTSKRTMKLIMQHAVNLIEYCENGMRVNSQDKNQGERLQSMIQYIQNTTIDTLKRFPDSDDTIDDFLARIEDIYNSTEGE